MAGDSTALTGFFSYAHDDNIFNCLRDLRDDVCQEYQILTGQQLKLFIDVRDLEWGSHWQESINSGIAASSFFLPILSPNYFLSNACVRELRQYMNKVKQDQAPELILPLLFSDFRDDKLGIDSDLSNEMKNIQWIDISSLVTFNRSIGPYGALVQQIALKLKRNNDALADRAKDANKDSGSVGTDLLVKPEGASSNRDDSNDAASTLTKRQPDDLQTEERAASESAPQEKRAIDFSVIANGGPRVLDERAFSEIVSLSNAIHESSEKIRNALSHQLGNIDAAMNNAYSSDMQNKAVVSVSDDAKTTLDPLINQYEEDANRLSQCVNDIGIGFDHPTDAFSKRVLMTAPRDAGDLRISVLAARSQIKRLQFCMRNKRMSYFSRILRQEITELKACNAMALGAFEFVLSWEIVTPDKSHDEVGNASQESSTPDDGLDES